MAMPSYINQESFTESGVEFGQRPWVLPGTFTRPKESGQFPCVILVHGSGPQDRNETIGPNQPFRDLAWGLASKQIAVLRYEKRTRIYPDEFKNLSSFTIKEETTDDVISAIEFVRGLDRVDNQKIFVLGHSLGGFILPRILKTYPQTEDLAGVILLAANARSLDEVMASQVAYLETLEDTTADIREVLESMKTQIGLIKSLRQNPRADVSPFDVPSSYWIDLQDYHPPETLCETKIPALILQGESDYQVRWDSDFRLWQEHSRSCPQLTCLSYPGLHHLFMTSSTPMATPRVYAQADHVHPRVLTDIVNWIGTGSTHPANMH
ncbi:MAG: alpha/beta fold hydrolase [Firmicutes bacterium]|nr:alpha/beta fold hydrolase [Bacillota bacterium]